MTAKSKTFLVIFHVIILLTKLSTGDQKETRERTRSKILNPFLGFFLFFFFFFIKSLRKEFLMLFQIGRRIQKTWKYHPFQRNHLPTTFPIQAFRSSSRSCIREFGEKRIWNEECLQYLVYEFSISHKDLIWCESHPRYKRGVLLCYRSWMKI